MTENEIAERSDAQREKCLLCRHSRTAGCEGGGVTNMPTPPEDASYRSHFAIIDRTFFRFGLGRHNIRPCWQPALAAASCVGYERRSNP